MINSIYNYEKGDCSVKSPILACYTHVPQVSLRSNLLFLSIHRIADTQVLSSFFSFILNHDKIFEPDWNRKDIQLNYKVNVRGQSRWGLTFMNNLTILKIVIFAPALSLFGASIWYYSTKVELIFSSIR